jgi:methylglutaconyl-CoA hydratase
VVTLQTLSVEVSPRGIMTILLNRPERGNAVNQQMLNELAGQLGEAAADERTRMVVLRGAGKHYCAGADLAARGNEPVSAEPQLTLVDVLTAIDMLPKPTIAVVHGAAIGGGAGFAACCDVVIAVEGAFFSIPEVRIGMAPLGVAPFLIRAVGHRNFRRYGLSGERIDAAEALRIGLAHQVCDAENLDETLAGVTDALLHGAPNAIRELKADMDRYASPSMAAVLARKPAHAATLSEEAREGIASFKEKRKPRWYPQ